MFTGGTIWVLTIATRFSLVNTPIPQQNRLKRVVNSPTNQNQIPVVLTHVIRFRSIRQHSRSPEPKPAAILISWKKEHPLVVLFVYLTQKKRGGEKTGLLTTSSIRRVRNLEADRGVLEDPFHFKGLLSNWREGIVEGIESQPLRRCGAGCSIRARVSRRVPRPCSQPRFRPTALKTKKHKNKSCKP